MTIDERLDRLTERHEALTRTVELMAAENRQTAAENRQTAAEYRETAAEYKERAAAQDKQMTETNEKLRHLAIVAEENEIRAAQMMDLFSRLGRIIQIHEQRIDSLEGRRPA